MYAISFDPTSDFTARSHHQDGGADDDPVLDLTAVQDDKGKKMGAVADVKNAMIFASICVLESEEHQKTFAPLFDENTRALGERHVPLLAGLTRDLFPLNKRAAVTQMSAFNANMLSSSNSPHMQMPISFTREKEDSAYMHEQYAAADRAHAELRASGLAGGVEVELTPPPNAKWCPPHLRNVRGKFYLHFVGGWFEHNDGAAAAAVTATDLLDSAETAGDATGDDPNAAADEADSSSSDEEGTPVRRRGMARL